MVTKLSFFSAIASVLLATACNTHSAYQRKIAHPANPVVAHRGAFKKNNLPENSIASLREAIRLGCAGSEFDVRMTADDSLVINHDPNYHQLPIEKHSYAELLAFPLANGEKIPTLREYLLAGKTNNKTTTLVVEIKPSETSKERGKRIAEKVLDLVGALHMRKKVIYISFDYDMLQHLHNLDATAHTQYLNGDKSPLQLKQDGINGADYHYSVFHKNPDWIQMAKDNGILLNAWTVNDKAIMDWLLSAGFHYITTNEPEGLFEKV